MLVSKLDVDDVIPGFSGAVRDLAGAVFLVFSVDVYFTGTLDRQAQSTVSCEAERGENVQNKTKKTLRIYRIGPNIRQCFFALK